MIRFSGFSSDDRYFAYSHFIENGKYRVVLLELDTMTSKELVLDRSQGSLRSVEWYGNEQKLLLTISPQDGVIKYVVPIDHFDLDHLTPLTNTP
jgi:Tol biopolymer transport system component